jgi:RNA polymerase sigma-70 factor (ECF subfamily)
MMQDERRARFVAQGDRLHRSAIFSPLVSSTVTETVSITNNQRSDTMTGEPELKALMLRSFDGDAASYRTLLDLLSRRLRAYYKIRLARTGRCAAEAEDLVQEALLAIHLKRDTYDVREPLAPWVHAIARYKLIDYLRRVQSVVHVPIDQGDEAMAQDDHLDAESSHDLRRLLQRLPAKVRCAIERVKLDGASVAEAALRCGISESAVKVNIHRGLRTLARLIARETKA